MNGDTDHGRPYPNLDALVENGPVEKGAESALTDLYAVTERGEATIAARQGRGCQYVDRVADG